MTNVPSGTFAVVYQFGKVASTALVEALNGQPGIEAVQSHFLGDEALQSILTSCLDPAMNEHFFYHQSGQLFKNLEFTRRIKRILNGNEPDTRLVVLLTVREPLDWLRSAITQDIRGYLDSFRETAKRHGIEGETIEELTQPALTIILDELADFVERFGSIDAFVSSSVEDRVLALEPLKDVRLEQIFYTMIRPFGWHDKLEPLFNCNLDDFKAQGDILSFRDSRFAAHLFRYEDMTAAVPQIAAELGLDETFRLSAHNVSEGKDLDEEVRAAFKSNAASRIAGLFAQTEYSRRFRYSS